MAEKVVGSNFGAFIIKKYIKFGDSKAYEVGWHDLPISQIENNNNNNNKLYFSNVESSQIKGDNVLDSPIIQKY